MRIAYLIIGFFGLIMTCVALVMPVVPATPFLVVALFGFSRGSETIYRWMISLRFIKPLYESLEKQGQFTTRQKIGLSFLTLPVAVIPFFAVESAITQTICVVFALISIVVVWTYRHKKTGKPAT